MGGPHNRDTARSPHPRGRSPGARRHRIAGLSPVCRRPRRHAAPRQPRRGPLHRRARPRLVLPRLPAPPPRTLEDRGRRRGAGRPLQAQLRRVRSLVVLRVRLPRIPGRPCRVHRHAPGGDGAPLPALRPGGHADRGGGRRRAGGHRVPGVHDGVGDHRDLHPGQPGRHSLHRDEHRRESGRAPAPPGRGRPDAHRRDRRRVAVDQRARALGLGNLRGHRELRGDRPRRTIADRSNNDLRDRRDPARAGALLLHRRGDRRQIRRDPEHRRHPKRRILLHLHRRAGCHDLPDHHQRRQRRCPRVPCRWRLGVDVRYSNPRLHHRGRHRGGHVRCRLRWRDGGRRPRVHRGALHPRRTHERRRPRRREPALRRDGHRVRHPGALRHAHRRGGRVRGRGHGQHGVHRCLCADRDLHHHERRRHSVHDHIDRGQPDSGAQAPRAGARGCAAGHHHRRVAGQHGGAAFRNADVRGHGKFRRDLSRRGVAVGGYNPPRNRRDRAGPEPLFLHSHRDGCQTWRNPHHGRLHQRRGVQHPDGRADLLHHPHLEQRGQRRRVRDRRPRRRRLDVRNRDDAHLDRCGGDRSGHGHRHLRRGNRRGRRRVHGHRLVLRVAHGWRGPRSDQPAVRRDGHGLRHPDRGLIGLVVYARIPIREQGFAFGVYFFGSWRAEIREGDHTLLSPPLGPATRSNNKGCRSPAPCSPNQIPFPPSGRPDVLTLRPLWLTLHQSVPWPRSPTVPCPAMLLPRCPPPLPLLFLLLLLVASTWGAPVPGPLGPRARVEGTPGNDVLGGTTSGPDTVSAGAGNDRVDSSEGGADEVNLGSGNDWAKVGSGRVAGGPGNDNILAVGDAELVATGDDGDDIMKGSDRDGAFSNLDGGLGDDILIGGPAEDTLNGGPGADRLYGMGGADFLRGGDGDDWIEGGEGDDNLQGEQGNDVLIGGDGKNRLEGGPGDDVLDGGPLRDHMDGGAGDDTLLLSGYVDNAIGGEGRDTFVLATLTVTEPDIIQDFNPANEVVKLPTQLIPGIAYNEDGGDPWVAWDQYFTISDVGDPRDRVELINRPGIVRERRTGFVFYYTDPEDLFSYTRLVRVLPTGTDITNRNFHVMLEVPRYESTLPFWARPFEEWDAEAAGRKGGRRPEVAVGPAEREQP